MLKKLGLLSVSVAAAFAMHGVDININDKDLELGGRLDMGQFNDTVEPNTVFLGVRYLKGNEDHSDFSSNDNAYYEISFLMQKEVSNNGLSMGLGVKANYTKARINGSNRDFTSVPLGVEAEYKLPVKDVVPLYLDGALYYAPEVLCMNDAEKFFEYRVNFDAEVIQNGRITLGYRSLDTNYDVAGSTVNKNYNHSVYLGFKFQF
ncbi:hypothetical protein [Sulfurimonas sp. HSL-1716]|uniref:hypothetical protein n=1 Tax=Hydrocurvibacter sulfurireducens TaxID=3131937 RepID=UPI0031F8571E